MIRERTNALDLNPFLNAFTIVNVAVLAYDRIFHELIRDGAVEGPYFEVPPEHP